jgi:hypothetical protein
MSRIFGRLYIMLAAARWMAVGADGGAGAD